MCIKLRTQAPPSLFLAPFESCEEPWHEDMYVIGSYIRGAHMLQMLSMRQLGLVGKMVADGGGGGGGTGTMGAQRQWGAQGQWGAQRQWYSGC